MNLTTKEAVEKGMVIGPRVFSCGVGIAMTRGHGYQNSVEADGPAEVRKAARQQLKPGADFIKVKASGGMVRLREVVTAVELTAVAAPRGILRARYNSPPLYLGWGV